MKARVLNPSAVELLMHTYYTPEGHPEAGDVHMQCAADDLLERELIEKIPSVLYQYKTTDRGNAYCEAIMRIPLPQQAWIVCEETI